MNSLCSLMSLTMHLLAELADAFQIASYMHDEL